MNDLSELVSVLFCFANETARFFCEINLSR